MQYPDYFRDYIAESLIEMKKKRFLTDDAVENWIKNGFKCREQFPGCNADKTRRYYNIFARNHHIRLFTHGTNHNGAGVNIDEHFCSAKIPHFPKENEVEYTSNSRETWFCWCEAFKSIFEMLSLTLVEDLIKKVDELEQAVYYAPPGDGFILAQTSFSSVGVDQIS